jgi:16S rRNA (guanine966-N2)-methyltransferase
MKKSTPKSSASRPAKSPTKRKSNPSEEGTAARESVGLRIIGGKHRGRPLAYSGDLRTRPMKDRLREAIFNLLGPEVEGAHAIDLFAGTGALGLEAISRGAIRATLIERHLHTSRLIEQNAASLGIEAQVEVLFADAFTWGRRNPVPQTRWVVFCSPPYDFYVERQEEMVGLVKRLFGAAPFGSKFIVEADDRFDFSRLPSAAEWDVRFYPPAMVGITTR